MYKCSIHHLLHAPTYMCIFICKWMMDNLLKNFYAQYILISVTSTKFSKFMTYNMLIYYSHVLKNNNNWTLLPYLQMIFPFQFCQRFLINDSILSVVFLFVFLFFFFPSIFELIYGLGWSTEINDLFVKLLIGKDWRFSCKWSL